MSSAFKEAMLKAGIEPPVEIIAADSALHRFTVAGDRARSNNGWYVLHADEPAAGAFGCWKRGISETWCAKAYQTMTQAEKTAYTANIEGMKRQSEEERERIQAECRAWCMDTWAKAKDATNANPYLKFKTVNAYGLKSLNDTLLVPVKDMDGSIHGIQFIQQDGSKKFKTGTNKTGHFFKIGMTKDKTIIICEGYATGASIYQATGHPVVVAFDSGNLLPVAQSIRKKFPDIKIIIAADDDYATDGNPGLTKANEAALSVNGLLAIPAFANNRGQKDTDFNDLARLAGLETVRACIESATGISHILANENISKANRESRNKNPEEWPEPLPLPDELPPVAPFDMDLLPSTLKPWASDIIERFQCPPDYVGAAIMAALSSVVGCKIGMRPQAQTDWTEVPNLWAILVGRSGVMKSPAMKAALAPLRLLAAKAGVTFQSEHEEYQSKARLLKIQAEEAEKTARIALKKNPLADVAIMLSIGEVEEPKMRRYIANDTTVPALAELLRHNPNGLLVYRDELVSLLKGLDREEAAGDRGFYLTAWNGNDPYITDRISRGMNLFIPAICLSLLGSTQPARIAEYIRHAVKGTVGDDGLIQRFSMLVWPDVEKEWKDIDRWPDHEAKREANKVFEYLDKLNPLDIGAAQDKDVNGEPEGIPYLRFDDAGRELFLEWRTTLESRLRGGDLPPALESQFAKYRKLIPALALLIHLAEYKKGPVEVSSVLAALAWGEYLESHALRAYASVITPVVAVAKAILRKLKQGEIENTFSARDIYRKGWSGLSEAELVRDGLTFLTDRDWLASTTIPKSEIGGRPQTIYKAHPRCMP